MKNLVITSSASKGQVFLLFQNCPVWNPNWQFWLLNPVHVLIRGFYLDRPLRELTSHAHNVSNVPLRLTCNSHVPIQPKTETRALGLHGFARQTCINLAYTYLALKHAHTNLHTKLGTYNHDYLF